MKREYEYRSIQKINKEGIWFEDGLFLDFELSRENWAKKHNISADKTSCVADRDITAASSYFEFYLDSPVVIYFDKRIFVKSKKLFQRFRVKIEKIGYTTYDLS